MSLGAIHSRFVTNSPVTPYISPNLIAEFTEYLYTSENSVTGEHTNIKIFSIPPDEVAAGIKAQALEMPSVAGINEGSDLFSNVLDDLDRLKDRLGGSPNFGHLKPHLDVKEQQQMIFHLPLSAFKDYLHKKIREEKQPVLFFTLLGRLFGVTKDNDRSQYEEAHISVQRFGLLVANKEYFKEILDNNYHDRFTDLNTITGLAWHPSINGIGTEKEYMDLVEHFLTHHYETAKSKGDDALIDYFKAFTGVCFEDRCRNLQEYILRQDTSISALTDIDTNKIVDRAYEQEAAALVAKMRESGVDRFPTPDELYDHLIKTDIFNMEFATTEGIKAKPNKVEYDRWAQQMVDDFILTDPADLD